MDESGSSPRRHLQERWRNNATVWINFQAPEAWFQSLAISKATHSYQTCRISMLRLQMLWKTNNANVVLTIIPGIQQTVLIGTSGPRHGNFVFLYNSVAVSYKVDLPRYTLLTKKCPAKSIYEGATGVPRSPCKTKNMQSDLFMLYANMYCAIRNGAAWNVHCNLASDGWTDKQGER